MATRAVSISSAGQAREARRSGSGRTASRTTSTPDAAERRPLEDDGRHRSLGHGSRDAPGSQADPHGQPEALEQPVPHPRVERRAIERLDQHLEVGEAPSRPRHLEPPAHREAALAEGVALRRRDQEVQGVRDLLRVPDPRPADVGVTAEPRREPAAQRKTVRVLERRAGDAGVVEARPRRAARVPRVRAGNSAQEARPPGRGPRGRPDGPGESRAPREAERAPRRSLIRAAASAASSRRLAARALGENWEAAAARAPPRVPAPFEGGGVPRAARRDLPA